MWDYIAFFGYNFLFFLFALFIWHVFPKPVPYDYTTIPGLKPDPNNIDDGNLQELRSSSSLRQFLNYLHEDYGPLSSFYWGRKYFVSVGNLNLWYQVVEWSRKIGASIDIVPIIDSKVIIPMEFTAEIFQKIGSKSAKIDEEGWKSAVEIIENFSGDQNSVQASEDAMNELIAQAERNLMSQNLPEGNDSTSIDFQKFRTRLLARAMKRCLKAALNNREDGTGHIDITDCADLPLNGPLRTKILDCIRTAVPYDYVVYEFSGEIDLQGHPIPAGVPIFVSVANILSKEPITEGLSARILPYRLQSNSKFLDQCVSNLPYMGLLISCVTTQFQKC